MNKKQTNEKAKDFKNSLKRLFKELKGFKTLILLAFFLAALSSVLSILTPNKLSDLTNEIQKGLILDTTKIEDLTNKIINNSNLQNIPTENTNLQNINEDMIDLIFNELKIDNKTITQKEQYDFLITMSNIDENTTIDEIYSKIDTLPENINELIKPKISLEEVKNIAILLIILYVASSIASFIESIIMTDVSNKFAKSLRSRISKKINKLPLKYFDNHKQGDTLSRLTNDVDTISQTMNQSLSSLVSAIFLFLGTILMMFKTNAVMALTAIISSLIGFIGMSIILKNSQKYFTKKQQELGNLNGHIEEVYSNLNIIKVYNAKEETTQKFEEYNKKLCEANKKSQFLSGIMQPLMSFIGNFGYVAVCIVGAILTKNNVITFGVIVAFMTYVRLFTSPLSQIAQGVTQLQSAAAASERVFEFIDEEEMSSQKEITKYLDKTKVKGKIEFDNVSFKYNEKPVIKNFTAKALPGQKIAIVGPTGAGKTTMVNLLMKFYEINKGNIKIDDIPINELTRENIHELFTMVLQDTWLFEGTIKENIKFNRENITDKQIEEACKEVGVDYFIKTLPNTYNYTLKENDNISGGQKQLLTIARGMIENSPFLILDEATSNVDTRTEELVQKAMDKLTEGKTSFIIAHRLSTIKNADLILVMKDGNIIEQGNHKELLKQNGFYSELYNSQFQK